MFNKMNIKVFLWFLGGAIAANVLMYAFANGFGGEEMMQLRKLFVLNIIVLWVGGMARILIDWQKCKKDNENAEK